MVERHTIETYGRAPHNRNIWSTATERHTIETYGRHAWPILLSAFQVPFIPLLSPVGQHGLRCTISSVIYTHIVRSFIYSFITEIYIAPFKVTTQKRSRHLHG